MVYEEATWSLGVIDGEMEEVQGVVIYKQDGENEIIRIFLDTGGAEFVGTAPQFDVEVGE